MGEVRMDEVLNLYMMDKSRRDSLGRVYVWAGNQVYLDKLT